MNSCPECLLRNDMSSSLSLATVISALVPSLLSSGFVIQGYASFNSLWFDSELPIIVFGTRSPTVWAKSPIVFLFIKGVSSPCEEAPGT